LSNQIIASNAKLADATSSLSSRTAKIQNGKIKHDTKPLAPQNRKGKAIKRFAYKKALPKKRTKIPL